MLTFIFLIKTFGRLTRVQSDRETEFKGAVKTFSKRSEIQNIESRPYHSQCQGKNDRLHGSKENQKET